MRAGCQRNSRNHFSRFLSCVFGNREISLPPPPPWTHPPQERERERDAFFLSFSSDAGAFFSASFFAGDFEREEERERLLFLEARSLRLRERSLRRDELRLRLLDRPSLRDRERERRLDFLRSLRLRERDRRPPPRRPLLSGQFRAQ